MELQRELEIKSCQQLSFGTRCGKVCNKFMSGPTGSFVSSIIIYKSAMQTCIIQSSTMNEFPQVHQAARKLGLHNHILWQGKLPSLRKRIPKVRYILTAKIEIGSKMLEGGSWCRRNMLSVNANHSWTSGVPSPYVGTLMSLAFWNDKYGPYGNDSELMKKDNSDCGPNRIIPPPPRESLTK